MKGLRINFSSDGHLTLDTATSVENRDALLQNMVMNMMTLQNSDAAFPDKGTSLLLDGIRGLMVDVQSAQHYANFAAADTTFFTRANDYASEIANSVVKIQMKPTAAVGDTITFQTQFAFVDATTNDQTLVFA